MILTPKSRYSNEPIYLNLHNIIFDNKYLNEYVIKIKSDRIYFNVCTNNVQVYPLELLIKMIINKEKINIISNNTDKRGKVLFQINFFNFQFIKINNLLDFDYEKMDNIMYLDVSYTFDYIEYINLCDPLVIRSLKINKILKKNNMIGYKLTKEHLGM